MKSLSLFAASAAGGAWLCWELRPAHYHHFVETAYDQPYLVFAFESLMALAAIAVLLLAVLAIQRELREDLLPWSANRLVRVQLLVISGAAITGIYGIRQIAQMHEMLRGDWGTGRTSGWGRAPSPSWHCRPGFYSSLPRSCPPSLQSSRAA
jgi:hypothetical protein